MADNELKVLMASMGMDIGGAETHILELCKALKREGVDVYVISNGGAYEDELKACGIKHFCAPLHNKNILNMFKSYKLIKKLIKKNDIKLVHAHARIPAFLCGLLKRRMKFKLVTTVHGIYNTTFLYRFLTNWGEKTLAVSKDLRQYLITNYNIPKSRIRMTINGIDTAKFSDKADYDSLFEELKVPRNSIRILNLSRMDKDMTMPTYALMDSAVELHERYGNIAIIIVGKGDDLKQIKVRAREVNRKLNKRVVFVAGGRVDANRFFAFADIFVGVSRSALEAMSAKRPVVLAGNQGYIGILNEKTLPAGIDTNFCCRGCKSVTKQLVHNDIVTLLEMDAEERARLGELGRNLIEKSYSVKKMADDALALYAEIRKPSNKSTDVVISGYYGSNNHGDDALLKAITDALVRLNPEITITALSLRPRETRSVYGVNSIHRFRFIKIARLLKDTKLLLSGGGTLVQDLTSSQSLYYYLSIINMAKRRGARVMLYANGIGPVRKFFNKRLAAKTLSKVDIITLRDEASLDVLKALKVKNNNVFVTADAAFGIKDTDLSSGDVLLSKLGLLDKRYFCIAVRSWKYSKHGFEKDIIRFADYITDEYGYEALFIPMQKSYDMDIIKRISSGMRNESKIIEHNFSLDEILGIIKGAEFLIAMRLHTLIYAATVGTPIIGLVYDPKVEGMMNSFQQRYYVNVSNFTPRQLERFADDVIERRIDISRELLAHSKVLQEREVVNAALAMQLINKNTF